LGGQAKPRVIYPLITASFPQLTPEDLSATLKHGEKRWINRIQWTRLTLISVGDMESPHRGVWAITEQGRKRLEENRREQSGATQRAVSPSVSLVELHEKYELQFRSKLLDRLYELTPKQFEHFARELLVAYGFVQVTVTQVGKDGGSRSQGINCFCSV
jgi:restriction system protein